VNPFDITKIGNPEQWLVEAGAAIGLDLSGLTHEITSYFLNHGIKRHGNAEAEKAQGQLPVTPADIDRIPDIVKNPDCAIIGIKRHNEILIAYSNKRIGRKNGGRGRRPSRRGSGINHARWKPYPPDPSIIINIVQ
jgi:hypothetical protein